jgi:hypothetical protein
MGGLLSGKKDWKAAHLYVSLLVRLPFSEASAKQPQQLPSNTSHAASTRDAVAAEAKANEGRGSMGIKGMNSRSGKAVRITAER